jgi:Dockerin type I domain
MMKPLSQPLSQPLSHPLSRLLAAGSLLAVYACHDGVTTPNEDEFAAARSITKVSSDVRISPVLYGTDGSVTYSVRVRSNSRTLSSFQGSVLFAPAIFELRSHTPTQVPGGVVMVNAADVNSGRIRFAAYTHTAFAASGEGVEVFRFVVRQRYQGDPAVSGMLDVIGTATNGTAAAGGAVANAIAADPACTGTSLWGDGNADGTVNITDAQQLARFATGLTVGNPTAVAVRGDVTADGSVNIVDAQQIARFSVGLSAAPRTNTWIC